MATERAALAAPTARPLPPPSLWRPLERLDLSLSDWCQARRCEQMDALGRQLKPLGDGRYTLTASFLCYFLAEVLHWPLLVQATTAGVLAFALAGAAVQLLQALTRRHRPNRGTGPLAFEGPALRSKHRSFPSGHTTVACALLGAFGLALWPVWPVSALAILLALGTGWSRLNEQAHWPSDVLGGIVLGFAAAWASVHWI